MNEVLLIGVVLGLGGLFLARLIRAKRSRPATRTAARTTRKDEEEEGYGIATMGMGAVTAAYIIGESLAGPDGDSHLQAPEGGGYTGAGDSGGYGGGGESFGGGDGGGGGGGGE
jgi:hypothetical protein